MYVYLDCETAPMRPGLRAPPLTCVTLFATGETHATTLRWCDALPAVRWALENATIVGHYIASDMTFLCAEFPEITPLVFRAYRKNRIEDTGIREKLRDIANGVYRLRGGYGLDDVALRTTGIVVDKSNPWRLRFNELRDVPIEHWPTEALAYAVNDVHCLPAIHAAQGPTLEDEPRQCRADFALALMSAWGVLVDQRRVDLLERYIVEEQATIEGTLRIAGLIEPRRAREPSGEQKRNMKRAQEWLAHAWPDCPRTPTGLPKTDENTLRKSNVPELLALGRYSTLNATRTTAIPLLREGVIHTRIDLAETGRSTSSSQEDGSGGNTQNLRRKQFGPAGAQIGPRECLVPRPGYIYISADFGGLELHTWAQVCKDLLGYSRMAELLIAGLDPHLEMARLILGITYEEAKARLGEEHVIDARQTGKVTNFGLPGGLGARSLVEYAEKLYGVKLTPERAGWLKGLWLSTYPEAKPYFDLIGRMTGQRGGKGTIRQVRSNRVRGGVYFTEACNSFFQGLGADIAKSALFDVSEACYSIPRSPLYGSRPVLFGHDEILAEAPIERASEAGDELSHLMVAAALPWLPDVPCIKAEPAMHSIYTKSAKTRRDANGRLVEWVQR